MEYEFLVENGPAKEIEDGKWTTAIYGSKLADGRFLTEFKGSRNVYSLFEAACQKYPKEPLHGHRVPGNDGTVGDYQWQSYDDVKKVVSAMSRAMQLQGCRKGARIGIYGANAAQWTQVMLSCFAFSATCVPLYDTVGSNAVEYVITHAEVEWIFVAEKNCKALQTVVENMGDRSKQIREICIWPDLSETDRNEIEVAIQVFRLSGIDVEQWTEVLATGQSKYAEAVPFPTPPSDPESTAVLMYTSGTTDAPKGVVLAHRAIVSAVASTVMFGEKMNLSAENGVHLSWLTLAHVYGFVLEIVTVAVGGRVGYWQGNVKKLADDIAMLKPTALCGVPRVWETIVDRINTRLSNLGPVFKWAFDTGFYYKKSSLEAGGNGDILTSLIDTFFFSHIRQSMGGEVLYIASGAAPLPRHLEEFLRVALSIPLIQGYGLTETCAVTCMTYPGRYDLFGTVGSINPCAEFRLESVPELEYDVRSNPPVGEICFRGACLFTEYFKNKEETEKVMDRDGFFHTGDIAELLSTGALRIIDRKKNIFKLSQGEYVAVEKIESTLKKASTVAQIWVYGDSCQRFLIAIVHPHHSRLLALMGGDHSLETLCASNEAKRIVSKELETVGREGGLKGFERVQAIALTAEEFTIENGLLTPSHKLKRHLLLRQYKSVVDVLYGVSNGKEK